jgi:alpha-L-arabinofuranosidase
MNVFERAGELVEMSAVSDLVNGWPGGIIQAGRHDVFVTAIYRVNRLYSTHRGDVRLATEVSGPSLDATASRSDNTIFIKAVNTDLTNPLTITIAVRGLTPIGRADLETISDPALNIQSRSIRAGNQLTVTLPKKSVSIITFKIR